VLFLLVERPGELVTRQEIREHVWGANVFLDIDSAINTAVRKIRVVLRDDPGSPHFIETIPAKGYRFIARIREARSNGQVRSRLTRFQTSLAGRENEMAMLHEGLGEATSGTGRLVMISGEPGIGKTRLAAELVATAQANRMTVLVGHCSDDQEAVSLLPFVEMLESFVDHEPSLDLLRTTLASDGPALSLLLPRIRNLVPELPAPPQLPPREGRRHLFNSFCDFVVRLARKQSVLMIVEDLHWADDSTLALLDHLTRRLADLPCLVIATYRDAELDVAGGLARTLEKLLRAKGVTRVELEGLLPEEVAMMLRSLSGQEPPATLTNTILAESRGNPFFIEELFRYFEEENRLYDTAGRLRPLLEISEPEAPPTVRLLVSRRLERLSDRTRKVLATAAVIGRSFSFEVLRCSSGTDADSILESLEEAEKAGLIFSVAGIPDPDFQFRHELTRQAVLTEMSVGRRQRLHLKVAQSIEGICQATIGDHLSELAHHYSRSSNAGKAVEYLTRTGTRIAGLSMFPEAMQHFAKALDILKEMPIDPCRDSRELELQMAIGLTAFTYQGEGSADAGKALARAAELAVAPEDTLRKAHALWFLGYHHVGRGELQRASEISRVSYEIFQQTRNPELELGANHLIGYVAFLMGDFRRAEQFLGAAGASVSRVRAELRGHALVLMGNVLWHLGFPDRALAVTEEGLMSGEHADDQHTFTTVLFWAGFTHVLCGELARAEDLFRRSFNLGTEKGFPAVRAMNAAALGLVSALRGHVQAGLEELRRGVELLAASSAPFNQPPQQERYYLAWGYELAGKPQEALATLTTVFEWSEQSGAGFQLASMHRLKGRLFEGKSNIKEAEDSFRTSIAIARRQSAKSPELSATTSLARLLAKQGHRDEAREMLAEIYNWFTEGFETADLKEAKALLDELNQ
jgi:tetratricopeptide (TPR) repeat protein